MQIIPDPELGFGRVTPTPDLETLRQRYQHEYYATDKPFYLEKTRRELSYWQGMWRIRLQRMRAELSDTERPRMLEIGASGGFFLDLARREGWQVEGVEPSKQAAAHARDELGLSVFQGFLEDFPEPEEPFEAIHLSLVLEHVRDPRAFIRHAMSLLRPGGVIWVEVPNDFNALQECIVQTLNKRRWWVVPEHHLNYFNYDSLSALLEWAGGEAQLRMGSFPMELFPLMGMDYIGDDQVGARAHEMRMLFETRVLDAAKGDTLERLYIALAEAGLGRTCNVMARKRST